MKEVTDHIEEVDSRPSKAEIIARLSSCLNDYRDSIPPSRVIGEGRYKVRTNWFQAVFGNLRYAVLYMIRDEGLKKEVMALEREIYLRRFEGVLAMQADEQEDNFVATTQEEIDKANVVLEKVIEHLEAI